MKPLMKTILAATLLMSAGTTFAQDNDFDRFFNPVLLSLFSAPDTTGITNIITLECFLDGCLAADFFHFCQRRTLLSRNSLVTGPTFGIRLLDQLPDSRRYIVSHQADVTICLLTDQTFGLGLRQRTGNGNRNRQQTDKQCRKCAGNPVICFHLHHPVYDL